MASNRPERPRRLLFAAAALLLPLVASAQPASTLVYELMLCGSANTGNTDAGFINTVMGPTPAPPGGTTQACMPVAFFDTGLTLPLAAGGGGGGAGAPRPAKITVVMPSGANAARLSALLGRGSSVSNLTLLRSVRQGGGERRLAFALVLVDARIESSQTSAVANASGPTETIVVNYARVRWLHWLDPFAAAPPSSDLCFNAVENRFC